MSEPLATGRYVMHWLNDDERACHSKVLVDDQNRVAFCTDDWVCFGSWMRVEIAMQANPTTRFEPVVEQSEIAAKFDQFAEQTGITKAFDLNRQARRNEFSRWRDFGPVTFAEAARLLAEYYQENELTIQVRCTSSPDDIRTIPVRRVVFYECGLRGAGSNAD